LDDIASGAALADETIRALTFEREAPRVEPVRTSTGSRRLAAALALLCVLGLALLMAAPHSHRSADECLVCRADRIAIVLTSAPEVDGAFFSPRAVSSEVAGTLRLESFSPSHPRAPPA
jgi:hypothetical protein